VNSGGAGKGGDETGGVHETGGRGSQATGGHDEGGANAGGAAGAPSQDIECLIAARVDECCPTPLAATRRALEADACLAEYPLMLSAQEIIARCPDADPDQCALVDCAAPDLPSRLVARNASGECEFVSECSGDADCTLALALDRCCPCPDSYPKTLVDEERCLVSLAMSFRPSDCVTCAGVVCSPCPQFEGAAVCQVPDDAPARCTWAASEP
jgi:hypothetical protein